MRPRIDVKAVSPEERARAEKVVGLLRAVQNPPVATPKPGEDPLQKTLEKGALAEKEGGPRHALDFYRERLTELSGSDKATLLLSMSELAEKSGSLDEAIGYLDEAVASGGHAGEIRLRKASLLWKTGKTRAANDLWEELSRSEEAAVSRPALLQLALGAERAGDSRRALTFYELVLARTEETAESNPARLGAAEIHRAMGHAATARQLYERVVALEPAGSDLAARAQQGLEALR
jgi:tetratricopeptide (TPR) repeat protein